MLTVLYVFIALLVLAFMIFIHELGHYTAGRLLGFKILDFSLGFGPAVFQFKKNDINYALRAIPLGGACRFYGEDDEPMDAVAFNAQKVWKRIIVVIAGPFMNMLLAYLLAVIMMFSYGFDKLKTYDSGATAICISDFSYKNSPAELGGIKKHDAIVAIDGVDITSAELDDEARMQLCTDLIINAPSTGAVVTVLRKGRLVDCKLGNIYNEQEGRNMLGVYLDSLRQPYGFFESFGKGFEFIGMVIKTTFSAIGGWFTGGIHQGDVSGVVGTVAITAKMASVSFYYLLLITALISLSLGLFNLLPFPALDGGRLVFLLIELIFRKPVPRKVEGAIHMVGLILLFALMILVTFSDIRSLINGTLFG